MQWPSDNNPIWVIARMIVVGGFLMGFLTLNYRNGWSPSDWNTMIGILTPLGVFDMIKHFVSGDRK